jgi:hypothetical protein
MIYWAVPMVVVFVVAEDRGFRPASRRMPFLKTASFVSGFSSTSSPHDWMKYDLTPTSATACKVISEGLAGGYEYSRRLH